MVNFGFPAFLKVLSLNEKPQATEIRKRVLPRSSGGYDFHKSLRGFAHRLLVGGEPISVLIAAASSISREAERKSAVATLERLEVWRSGSDFDLLDAPSVVFESPNHVFTVRFDPVFAIRDRLGTTAMHIWNTKTPKLSIGATYAALSLIRGAYADKGYGPDDVGVLSLREPTAFYRLGAVTAPAALATALVDRLESIIRGTGLPPARPEERPRA